MPESEAAYTMSPQPTVQLGEGSVKELKTDAIHHDQAQFGQTANFDKEIITHKNVGNLQRRLKSRHVQFLALSGAIGTGLFVGAGQVLSLAGPLSAVLAYLITGLNLYAVINSMGEMATWLPLPGAVPVYASR